MASYIGKTPAIGNFVKLDSISVVNGQASYTMQNGGANFTEYSNVNQFLVSLNGILQSPTDSFTVSSSTITFASNLSTGDVIDFIIVLGNSLDVGVPSDNTISTAKLQANAVTSAKMFSTFKNGITEADQWRLTANLSSDATPISSNLERVDDGSFGYIGTGMSVSSGVFTFPQTGYYLVSAQSSTQRTFTNDNTIDLDIQTTTNNSSYNDVVNIRTSGANPPTTMVGFGQTIVDVTDTTNVKVRFAFTSSNSNSLRGDTSQNETAFTFIRLGDT